MNKYDERMAELQAYYVREGEPQKLSREDLKSIEQQLVCRLPEDYAEFLSDYGCYGFDQYVAFPYQEEYPGGDEGILNVFFGAPSDGGAYDLFYNRETFAGRIPSNLLPIADDPGSNIICLSVSGGDRGRVYFWDREEEESVEEDEEPGYSNVYLVANSFDAFMKSLKFMEEEEEE